VARRPKSTARTKPDKQLALTLAAGVLAAAALAGCDSRPSSVRAPSCPPVTTQPGSAGWDDRDGCWERQPDGHSVYRTSSGGHYFYYSSPPSYSRYSETGGRWFSSGTSSGGYHGAPGASA
jgi:hypothetical protein